MRVTSFLNKVVAGYRISADHPKFGTKIPDPGNKEDTEHRLIPDNLVKDVENRLVTTLKSNLQAPISSKMQHSPEYGFKESDAYDFYLSGYSDVYDEELAADIGKEAMDSLKAAKPRIRFTDWNCDIEEEGESKFKYIFDFNVKWIRPDLVKADSITPPEVSKKVFEWMQVHETSTPQELDEFAYSIGLTPTDIENLLLEAAGI